ncbi:hypothetical protein AB0M57_29840 [Streptomyces sp. NPDC051597]|uniref:hypothetical protein n=1 Tax=Streptomyces sp. NPDC051597 TaxID=3155049 RepID=UPI0034454F39
MAALIAPAFADVGRRISVHLADEGDRACILVLSHHTPGTPTEPSLTPVADCPAVAACGTSQAPDGTRLWAVIELTTQTQHRPR